MRATIDLIRATLVFVPLMLCLVIMIVLAALGGPIIQDALLNNLRNRHNDHP